MITGILPVDKPLGWTSHDVVARLRRVAGQRQVGHAGTLDPLATGVLLIMLGQATRLSNALTVASKEYRAEVVLGVTTRTDDAEAEIETRADVSHVDRGRIDAVLSRFTGTLDQVPPQYAAVRQGGERLYVLARRGEMVEAAPRRVTIDSITIEEWRSPRLRLRVRCGSGTYVRALARDIGAELGVGGYLHALRRTASGSFTIDDCTPLERLVDRAALLACLLPADRAVVEWPAIVLNPEQDADIRQGRPVPIPAARGSIRVYASSGRLVALAEGTRGMLKPFRVFAGDATDY